MSVHWQSPNLLLFQRWKNWQTNNKPQQKIEYDEVRAMLLLFDDDSSLHSVPAYGTVPNVVGYRQ
jgi:hypothetical protein